MDILTLIYKVVYKFYLILLLKFLTKIKFTIIILLITKLINAFIKNNI